MEAEEGIMITVENDNYHDDHLSGDDGILENDGLVE